MSDDVQREIEANERRARDEEDVGVEEDSLRDGQSDDRLLGDVVGGVLPRKDDDPDVTSDDNRERQRRD